MSEPREDLLGYLLDALEDSERARIEAALAQDASLQEELAQLRRLLNLLEPARQTSDPPPGLAERTCAWIASQSARLPQVVFARWEGEEPAGSEQETAEVLSKRGGAGPQGWISAVFSPASETDACPSAATLPQAALFSRQSFSEDARRQLSRPTPWRWPDLLMAASVAAVLLLILFSGIHQSRFHQAITQCQENLRQVGRAMLHYSELHQDLFPPIPSGGHLAAAGMYAPILIEGGFIQEQRVFWCPGDVRQGTTPLPIPPLGQLQRTRPEQWEPIVSQLGGSYGYSLGYVEAGQYRPTRNRHRPYFALLADAPSPLHPELPSPHHAGKGQNVCFEDGHVEFVSGCTLPLSEDHFFLNDQGRLAPGIGPEDSVVAPGGVRLCLPAGVQQSQ